MRLIDADALKEMWTKNWDYENCIYDGTFIVDCIDSMPTIATVEPTEWIHCGEELPKEKGEYLVTYHPCYWDKVENDIKVGIDTFRGKTAWAKKKYQKVIAWRQLPEPYMEVGNETD